MELFDLTRKVAIVIGGSRGIGLAIAEGLASCGAHCVIAARDLSRAEAAAEGIRKKNFRATAISVDVAERKSVENLAEQTLQKFRRIDILVNSAAMILRKPIEEVTDDEWNAILSINLTGIFISCQVVGRENQTPAREDHQYFIQRRSSPPAGTWRLCGHQSCGFPPDPGSRL